MYSLPVELQALINEYAFDNDLFDEVLEDLEDYFYIQKEKKENNYITITEEEYRTLWETEDRLSNFDDY